MKVRRPLARLLVAALALAAPAAADPVDPLATGPLPVGEQFLLGAGLLSLTPISAEMLPAGRWQFDLVLSATNTWALSDPIIDRLAARDRRRPIGGDELTGLAPGRGIYLVDGELYRIRLAVRRGFGRVELGLAASLLDADGGFGDGAIEGFHDALGFGQVGRLGVPKDAYTIYVRDRSGRELFVDRAPDGGLGDIELTAKLRLPSPAPRWSLALVAVAELPTGDERALLGSDGTDFGLELAATRASERWRLHAGLDVLSLAANDRLGLERQTLGAVRLTAERTLGRRYSAQAQLRAGQSPFHDLGLQKLEPIAYLLDIGLKARIGERTVLVIGFSENVVRYGNTADVSGHLGLVWRPEASR